MEEQVVLQILELLETMQEACQELYTSAEVEDTLHFDQLCGDMSLGLTQILQAIEGTDTAGDQKLTPACESILDSLRRVKRHYRTDREMCLRKIEFELLPLLQTAYGTYYFFQYLVDHPDRMAEYDAEKKKLLFANSYIDDAVKTGTFKYELSIFIQAYNKLDYTKMCVESLLANLPADLNYELILVNHGSSDGTKEYFESLHPQKQLDVAVNGGGVSAVSRIFEGEFLLGICNDVLVMPHAIENMLSCLRSAPQIAWVVPSTPNVSNLQSIPAQYSSLEELVRFARQNNFLSPFRWEQRVRLCNPIHIMRSSVFYASEGLCVNGAFHTSNPVYATSFPDDKTSLLLRRNGYKMMLAKDAYCHHFGSVTLKSEIQQHNEQKYYAEGREEFRAAYGVDPWGCGFCYDPVFMDRIVGNDQGHIEVLGINCGLGSNALKVKEQVKEFGHNMDCKLSFLTDDTRYLSDLMGIGDEAKTVLSYEELAEALNNCLFHYIVWETPILIQYEFKMLLDCFKKSLSLSGRLIMKRTDQNRSMFSKSNLDAKALGNDWFVFQYKDLA